MVRLALIPGLLVLILTGPLPAQDWISLFDGRSLEGWKVSERPETFRVIDGALVHQGERAHAFYVGPARQGRFKNFEFQAEVMTAPGTNSGIYIHSKFRDPGYPEGGYEIQINNSQKPHGNYYEFKKTGSLYGVRNLYKAIAPDNAWFTMAIRVVNSRVQVRVNDVLVVDYVEPKSGPRAPRLAGGTFALQGHDPGGRVAFRNLRVRPLPDDLPDEIPAPEVDPQAALLKYHRANFPIIDLHAHLKKGLTLEEVLRRGRATGINYGLAVNCGVGFPITDDRGIQEFVASMKGQPVFVGMQAEGREWVKTFSPAAIRLFDYVFTDAMTFTDDRTGQRTRLWVDGEFTIGDEQAFMDMLVRKIVGILAEEPIDIYVNPTFLPAPLAGKADALWTEARRAQVIAALVKNGVALEINARYKLPSPTFLREAKKAGVKFTIGTNNGGPEDLVVPEYALRMIEEIGLKNTDFFVPGPEQPRAIDRKTRANPR